MLENSFIVLGQLASSLMEIVQFSDSRLKDQVQQVPSRTVIGVHSLFERIELLSQLVQIAFFGLLPVRQNKVIG